MESEYLGYAAGILTTLAFFPQAYKILRTGQSRDISMLWIVAMNLGSFLWLCYGIVKNSMPIISANAITLVLLMIILLFKIRHR
jgi:MtN3 and saliva related transmembrane protein